jgi:hypothetical protein
VLHFSLRIINRLLYPLVFVAILFLHLEKEHEERHWLTDHLRTKMKYRVLKNKGRNQKSERFCICLCIEMREVSHLFWQILNFMAMWNFRDKSFNFSSYNDEYLVCRRRFVCLLTVMYSWNLYCNIPVHILTSFLLSCFFMLHSHIRLRLQIPPLRHLFPMNIMYEFLISPILIHVTHSGLWLT